MSTSTRLRSRECLLRVIFLVAILQGCLELPTPAQRDTTPVASNASPTPPEAKPLDSNTSASAELDANLPPDDFDIEPECGNGIVEVNEECDDDSEACSSACRLDVCGNNRVDPGERCDDGNQSDLDSCIANCQVVFPEEWSIYGDWNFTDSSFAFEYCFANFPPNITPGQDSGDTMGRRSYFLWGGENNLWVPITFDDDTPFRLTLTIHIPEGYERSLTAGLVTNFETCAAEWQGAYLRQEDVRHLDSEQEIKVSATTTADAITQNYTGTPRAGRWLELSFEHVPSSGHFRIKYEGELVLQSVLNETIRGFRIEMTQNTMDPVETPISIGTFVMEIPQ